MSCLNQYERKGYRTYGGNIPGNAQGCYFPGDEPGCACKLSGELCTNEDGDNPADCAALKKTQMHCHYCLESGKRDNFVSIDGHGAYFCQECYSSWKNLDDFNNDARERLTEVVSGLLYDLEDANESCERKEKIIGNLEWQISRLKDALVRIQRAVDGEISQFIPPSNDE